jgi:hypothetical protein
MNNKITFLSILVLATLVGCGEVTTNPTAGPITEHPNTSVTNTTQKPTTVKPSTTTQKPNTSTKPNQRQ